jgi:hypothetical protein
MVHYLPLAAHAMTAIERELPIRRDPWRGGAGDKTGGHKHRME